MNKPPQWFLLVIAASAFFFSSLFLFEASVHAQYNTPPSDCPPMPNVQCSSPTPKPQGQAWPQGAHGTINIDPSFSSDKANAIKQSFQNWQAAGIAGATNGNGSGVTFTFTSNATPPSMTPPAGTYNVQVWNQNPPGSNSGKGGWEEIVQSGGHAVAEEIWINTGATDPCAVAQTAAHEAGHGFGLDECPGCADYSTVMNEGNNGYNSLNAAYGPTTCDNNVAKSAGQYPTQTEELQGGGGGGDPDAIMPVGSGGCTPYYWVWYESYDGGQTWEATGEEEYAGCW